MTFIFGRDEGQNIILPSSLPIFKAEPNNHDFQSGVWWKQSSNPEPKEHCQSCSCLYGNSAC